jgi:hypothetical protein
MCERIAKNASITISSEIHFECCACGANITREFIYFNYADTIYVECPYCKTHLVVYIDWYEWSDK